jgi:rhamnosyltransferase
MTINNELNTIGAVIVTYYPDDQLITNLKNIKKQIPTIIIVDNGSNLEVCERLESYKKECNFTLIKNKKNYGIAEALNIGCDLLYSWGYEYAILLDQDSIISDNLIDALINVFKMVEKAAIVGPLILPINEINCKDNIKSKFVFRTSKFLFQKKFIYENEQSEVAFNITSGSLIKLSIWNEIGKFWSGLFIDGVDDEYCLRLNDYGYTTIITGKTQLYQQYGNQKSIKKFGVTWNPTFHPPYRLYYLIRNKILIIKRHYKKNFFYILFQIVSITKRVITIMLMEDNASKKLYAMLLGLKDGIKNVEGSIPEHYLKRIIDKSENK